LQLEQKYWEQRYQNHTSGWDIGSPSTPIQSYIDQLKDRSISILIPGAGNAYEAEYLHNAGFSDVTVIDFAPSPIAHLRQRVPEFPADNIIEQDFFEHKGQYDLILEQTFFCALTPNLRERYAEKTLELLKPGGTLAGLLFSQSFEKPGPPFGGSLEEYRSLFQDGYHIKVMESCYNSIAPRHGSELFFIMNKKIFRNKKL